MRIAILTDYYYPQLGGITEHVHGQATNLSARGHEVTVITGNLFRPPSVTDADPAPVSRDAPFEIIRMGQALRLYGNASQTLHTLDFRMISKMKKLFRERRFDVIHTHAPYNPGFVMLAPFAAPSVGDHRRDVPLGLLARAAARRVRPRDAHVDRAPGRQGRGVRGLHRLARAVLPVRLHRHPQRDRRAPLHARRRPDRAPARRPHEHPLPRPVRSAQRPRHHDRRVHPRPARVGAGSPARRGRRRAAAQLLPEARPRRHAGRRPLGRPRRLGAAALLHQCRCPLHAVQSGLVRHGAARGDELRPADRREPHLRASSSSWSTASTA